MEGKKMKEKKFDKITAERKKKVLHAAAKMFLEKGYTESTVREISRVSGVEKTAMIRAFGGKENILAELVKYVLEGQFSFTAKFLEGKTEDKILFYAAETTLQLYMAESNESIRNLYSVAYSMPNTSEIIQNTITAKLEEIFKKHLPKLKRDDFYELEIASGGIMRSFMILPCNQSFTMERKVARFIETTLLIYRVPDEKIKETIEFVSQFDYPMLAQTAINHMLSYLEQVEKVYEEQ